MALLQPHQHMLGNVCAGSGFQKGFQSCSCSATINTTMKLHALACTLPPSRSTHLIIYDAGRRLYVHISTPPKSITSLKKRANPVKPSVLRVVALFQCFVNSTSCKPGRLKMAEPLRLYTAATPNGQASFLEMPKLEMAALSESAQQGLAMPWV